MTCTDPTGQLSLFGHKILPGLFNNKNVRVVASIVAAYYLGPAGGLWSEGGALSGLGIESAFAQSAIAGFASGAIASGSLKGGLQGAFSASLFYGAGNIASGGDFWSVPEGAQQAGWGTGVAVHAVAGCVASEVGGGTCGSGALSAAFTKGIGTRNAGRDILAASGSWERLAITSTIGGTASVLGGGKFSNGAETAAFSYIFNEMSHAARARLLAAGTGLGALGGFAVASACTAGTGGFCALGGPTIVGLGGGLGLVSADRLAAAWDQLDRLVAKASNNGPDAVQYALLAETDGLYPTARGDLVFLRANDVWKYGVSTNMTDRYLARALQGLGLRIDEQTYGTESQVLVVEKAKIINYVQQNGHLPPGNYRFK